MKTIKSEWKKQQKANKDEAKINLIMILLVSISWLFIINRIAEQLTK